MAHSQQRIVLLSLGKRKGINLLKPTGYLMHQQFNIHTVFICFVFI